MNLLNENIEKLKALFPEIVTDGKIDFDMLKTLLGEEVDASNEKYSFNWVGKRNCIKFAQTPSTGTLIPCKEKSVDFDNTQNIYIEGDNVEALKLLQKTYFGKIKMIYIDPPYNTGNDFVYHDDYKDSIENYKKITGQQATANPETNGRFHTDWLNMMYPRLKLAKDLLSDDGVIFISLDDNEAANIKKIGDEIFGESNFIGQITVVGNPRGRDYGGIARMHDYIFAYKKTSDAVLNLVEDKDSEFEMFDEFGGFELRELRNRNIKFNKENRPNLYYPFYIDPQNADKYGLHPISIKPQNGFIELYPLASQGINTVWRWGKAKSFENLNVNIMAKPMKNGSYMIVEKYRESKMMARSVWWDKKTNTENGTLLVKELMDGKVFDYPKPVEMLMRLCEMGSNAGDEGTILDFFSGSATTAHAVMQLNAEDGGNRKFIMVQLPELCDEKSEAYKAGYKTICDIGEERIRRAGAKIKEENPLTTLNLDTGFKVFRLDSTNIVPWNNAEKLDEMRLYDYAKTIKDGRDDLSVAYEIMLKYGVFDKPMKETVVSGKKMYDVGEGYMIICLADGVTMTDVEAIARLNPHCVVFKESGFADDNEKINATHTLERGGVEKILCI